MIKNILIVIGIIVAVLTFSYFLFTGYLRNQILSKMKNSAEQNEKILNTEDAKKKLKSLELMDLILLNKWMDAFLGYDTISEDLRDKMAKSKIKELFGGSQYELIVFGT